MVSAGVIVALVMCFVLVIVGTVLGVYYSKVACPDFGSECTTSPAPGPAPGPAPATVTSPPAPGPAPGPAPATVTSPPVGTSPTGTPTGAPLVFTASTPTDPRSTVWSTGQMIQSAPVVISVATPPAPTNQPSGLIAGGSVSSYTLSLDLYYSGKQWSDWFGILEMGAYPAVWLTPKTTEGVGAFGVQTVPRSGYLDTNNVRNVPVNTWFNLVAVYNVAAGTCSLYYNGTNVASSTPFGAIWPSPLPRMVFNSRGHTETTVKVANIYWWNSALSDAQAAQLVIPAAG